MSEILKNLKPFQKIEFLSMLLVAITIPLSWRLASYSTIILFVGGLLKGIFEHGFRPNPNQYRHKVAYFIFGATFIMYFIGILYSKNTEFAWMQIDKKLIFLILPVYFLVSNLSYLNEKHFKSICYSFVIITLLVFIVNFSWASFDYLFNGASINRFFDDQITKIYYVHHSYMAMYACLGMVFCFTEFFNSKTLKIKILNVICFILLAVFVILLNSRAGLLCMLLLFIVLWGWLFFIKKQKKLGIIAGSLLLVVLVSFLLLVPSSVKRITDTVKNIKSTEKEDRRIVQYQASLPILFNDWMFGVGTGDRWDEINRNYEIYKSNLLKEIKILHESNISAEENKAKCMDSIVIFAKKYANEPTVEVQAFAKKMAQEFSYDYSSIKKILTKYIYISESIEEEHNTHNQYFETLISIGIIGVLLLLAYFVIPILLWIKNKNFDILFFSFLIIIAFNALFESILETQKGIIFFVFFYVLFFHVSFCKSIKK